MTGYTPAITTLVIACGASLAMGNIVTNGGFEDASGPTTASGWNHIATAPGSSSASSTRSTAMPAAGDAHLALSVTGAADGGPLAEAQFQTALFSITPGVGYDLSLLAKRVDPLGVGIVTGFEVQWLDSDGSAGGGVRGSTGFFGFGGDLTENYEAFGFSNQIAAPDSDAALVIIRLVGGAIPDTAGTVYVDNVSLTVVPAPGTLAAAGLLGLAGLRRRR